MNCEISRTAADFIVSVVRKSVCKIAYICGTGCKGPWAEVSLGDGFARARYPAPIKAKYFLEFPFHQYVALASSVKQAVWIQNRQRSVFISDKARFLEHACG